MKVERVETGKHSHDFSHIIIRFNESRLFKTLFYIQLENKKILYVNFHPV